MTLVIMPCNLKHSSFAITPLIRDKQIQVSTVHCVFTATGNKQMFSDEVLWSFMQVDGSDICSVTTLL